MQSKDAIRYSLTMADEGIRRALPAIEDAPLTFPTANSGCHPIWVMGHLALVEAMTHELLTGEANPIAAWGPLFGPSTTPVADSEMYPPLTELKARYAQLRKGTMEFLDSLSEADLDTRVANPPAGLEEHFATYGRALLTLALHQMSHRAHLTDAVRQTGREVLSPFAQAA